MYVCLCVGATSKTVSDAVAAGAVTSREVAALCGAGGDCGRCRCTVRGIIADTLANPTNPTTSSNPALRAAPATLAGLAEPAGAPTCAANESLRHLALEITPVGAC